MSDALGPVLLSKASEEVFLGMDIVQRNEYSEDTARSIDKEIRAILGDAYTRAKDVLKSNLAILHSMAEALLEREVLDGKDIDEIIHANGGSLPTGASA